MISDDPQIAVVLQTVADRIRARGYESLAFKIENLVQDITNGDISSVRSPRMKAWVMERVGEQVLKLMEV